MRAVLGEHLTDFTAIYDEDVELVIVTDPQAERSESISKCLVESRQALSFRWVQTTGDMNAPDHALPATIGADLRSLLIDEVVEVGEVLSELMGCEQVGVRLETLTSPMCPRFHVDQVPCRMLITLNGKGTDWIPNRHVDWAVLADLGSTAVPLQPNGQIEHLPARNWSLLKGGSWSQQFGGVVHRSPHDSDVRLLLSLDPVWT